MKTDETIKTPSDKAFLDKLFAYAYRRCNTSQDAECLCSELSSPYCQPFGKAEKAQLSGILKEISFLSKIYRQTMILYYLDEMKIGDIAKKLSVSESTVKQRLFFARNTIKKEVSKIRPLLCRTHRKRKNASKPLSIRNILTRAFHCLEKTV